MRIPGVLPPQTTAERQETRAVRGALPDRNREPAGKLQRKQERPRKQPGRLCSSLRQAS